MISTNQTIRTLNFVPSDWFVKFDSDFQKLFKTKKFIRIVKLIENSKPIGEFEEHILLLKRRRGSTPISFKPFINLDSKFIRMWSFLIGDGCMNRSKIRAYDIEPKPLISFVELLRDFGYSQPNVYVTVPGFVHYSQLQRFRKKWAKILRVPLESIHVWKERKRYYEGRLIKSDKEYVEVVCFSDTVAWIFTKLAIL